MRRTGLLYSWMPLVMLLASGVVLLILVLTLEKSAHATFPGKNGKIAFLYGNNEIYTMNPDGGRRFRVTHTRWREPYEYPTVKLNVNFSPDGKTISFVGANNAIYTINVRGGGRFKVVNNTTNRGAPSYSPNGKKIAYQGYDGHDFEIYTINIGGGSKHQVTSNPFDDFMPSWGSRS
jgi:Tol biopolymer transport system component